VKAQNAAKKKSTNGERFLAAGVKNDVKGKLSPKLGRQIDWFEADVTKFVCRVSCYHSANQKS